MLGSLEAARWGEGGWKVCLESWGRGRKCEPGEGMTWEDGDRDCGLVLGWAETIAGGVDTYLIGSGRRVDASWNCLRGNMERLALVMH